MDEHAGPLDVVGDDGDVGPDERRELAPDRVAGHGSRRPSAASAAVSKRVAIRSTMDHRTSCLDVTWAYRLAPWMSSARAMSRTLVPE